MALVAVVQEHFSRGGICWWNDSHRPHLAARVDDGCGDYGILFSRLVIGEAVSAVSAQTMMVADRHSRARGRVQGVVKFHDRPWVREAFQNESIKLRGR